MLLLAPACSSTNELPGDGPGRDELPGDGDAQSEELGPAVLIGVFVRSPEGRNVYVGAVPEVPTGKLDYSGFLEFGDVEASTHGGHVFVWDREPAIMTRYSVTEDLRLLESGPPLSFLNQGAGGGGGFGATVYVSETRAYTLSSALDVVIVWDPEAMEITGTIEMDPPDRPDVISTSPAAGYLVGDKVVWPLTSTEWDGENYFPGVAVAIADARTNDPVRIVEDERCVGSDGAHVDDHGGLLLRAGGYWGSSAAYGDSRLLERTCVLRIQKGESEFDPSYLVDMKELTGSYINFPWFHVEGPKYVAQAWDPKVAIPENIDDFWSGAGLTPLLVDLETGESQPYPDVAGYQMVSSAEFKLDGVTYYQLSRQGTAADGTSDIVELRDSGVVAMFTVPELWALARIR